MANARQLVNHGHVFVNGKRVDVASFQTKPGDVITLADNQKANVRIQRSIASQVARSFPSWLELNPAVQDALARSKDFPVDLKDNKVEGTVKLAPSRDEMSYPVNEQYIVELYSK
jgi:small subunit ribosomal protein S4